VNEPKPSIESDLDDAFDRLEQRVSRDEAPGRSGVSATAVAALVMSFLALGGAAYSVFVGYQQQQAAGSLNEDLLALGQPIRQAEMELAELERKVNSSQTLQLKQAGQLQQQMSEVVREVQSLEVTSSRDWLLAEVEYLLRLANQRILVENDVDAAIGLLMSADDILEKSVGISAFQLRGAIANDLASLKAVGGIDRDGLFLQLGALVNQVDLLQQRRMSYQSDQVIEASADADTLIESPLSWMDRIVVFFDKVYVRLSGLVNIRRDSERIQPILPPVEEYYLRQNLILKLEQAQVASIKGTQTVFEYSLNESLKWIELYFEPTDPLTQSMSAALRDLLQVKVERQLPDISPSLVLIREMLAEFHHSPPSVVSDTDESQ
jgi:uroporphyrin-3 C-methyltransferase